MESLPEYPLYGLRYLQVNLFSLLQQGRFVCCLLSKRMLKQVLQLVHSDAFPDKLHLLEICQPIIQTFHVTSHISQNAVKKAPPNHRGYLYDVSALLIQPVNPGHQHIVDGPGNDNRLNLVGHLEAVVSHSHSPFIYERTYDLFDKEGIPSGPFDDLPLHAMVKPFDIEHIVD